MSLFSGQRLTERNIEHGVHEAIKRIVNKLHDRQIDPPVAIDLLYQLVMKTAKAMTRTQPTT